MARTKLPHASDWKARKLSDWNTTTFRAYLVETHRERYGIEYVSRSVKQEVGMLANMIKAHGKEVVKTFIDECFRQYKPTQQYPGINFAFMYTYMKERTLPKILLEKRRKQERETTPINGGQSAKQVIEWL